MPSYRNATRVGLVGVVALGAFLRLHGLEDAPAWYGDEFVHLELAQNLRSLDARVGAFRVDWFGTIAHPPLFFLLGAVSLALFGDTIGALRLVPALAGTASIALLFWAGSLLRDRCLGLLAAASYAVLPLAVMLDRRAYAYPLVFPLALAVFVCLLEYRRSGRARCLYAGAALMSLLLVTGHYTLPLLGVFAAFLLVHDRRHAHRYLAVAAVLPLVFSLVFMLPRWEVASFTLGWELERASSESVGAWEMLRRNGRVASSDAVFTIGALGLVYARCAGLPWFGLIFLAVSQFLLYRRPEIGDVYYPSGAFLGLFALPFAAFFVGTRDLGLRAAARRLAPGAGLRAASLAVAALALGAPAWILSAKLAEIAPAVWRGEIATPVDPLAERADEVASARHFLRAALAPGDLVAGSYAITHGLPGARTDLMQSYVYETGRGTPFYPAYAPGARGPGLPGYREKVFAFDCSLERVDFLVLSRADWGWSLERAFARELLGAGGGELRGEWAARRRAGAEPALTIRGAPWPVVHRAGAVWVLRNPARAAAQASAAEASRTASTRARLRAPTPAGSSWRLPPTSSIASRP